MKVNMALSRLPVFTCLPQNRGQHNSTMHLLPPEKGILQTLQKDYEGVQKGRLAQFPAIEWYIHTQLDPSLQDAGKHHSSAFFVQWVPYQLEGSTWEQEEEGYVHHLFSIAEQFAPGFTASVVEYSSLNPQRIEEVFGISYGHIHHIDNAFGFDQRMPYKTPIEGLYACSAGCHPAGSVIGASGYNAAQRVLKDHST
jgi:phytoene dehydrogenase-like protein